MKLLYVISLVVTQIFFIFVILLYYSQPPDPILLEHAESQKLFSIDYNYFMSFKRKNQELEFDRNISLLRETSAMSKNDSNLDIDIEGSGYDIESDFVDKESVLMITEDGSDAKTSVITEATDNWNPMGMLLNVPNIIDNTFQLNQSTNDFQHFSNKEEIDMLDSDQIVQETKSYIINEIAKEFASTIQLNEPISRDENSAEHYVKLLENIKSQKINISIGERQKDVFKLGSVVPSSGARKIMIVTHGRSGSSFIGEMLAQYPGTFYSYEPLHLDKETLTLEDKIERIKQVLKCEPTERFVKHSKDWGTTLRNNFRFHSACQNSDHESCYNLEVYKAACEISPVRLIKTIRLPFAEANTLLMDPDIGNNLKIIFLFRDPRGVHQSVKSKVRWLNDGGISKTCKELESDTLAAITLKRQHPGKN